MKRYLAMCGLLGVGLAGCSAIQGGKAPWRATSKKIVTTHIDDFEKEGRRLCPFGYDVVGEHLIWVEGKENTRYIKCRNE